MGEVYCQGLLIGTDCFGLVNDFIKLPAKCRLTSSQVITIVWEATAQPSYRDCERFISPAQGLGSPFPSQQLWWPPGSMAPSSPQCTR